MSENLLEMRGITKHFGGVTALDHIDLELAAGECLGLCGENGAGKSTLMKILSGVYPPDSWQGQILWQGRPLQTGSLRDTEQAGIVIIHQELMLIPALSVTENIFLGHELTRPGGRMDYPAMHKRAAQLMAELNMPDLNVALPVASFGGGHQQLIEIARALNKQARLLILDEPSSSLSHGEIAVLLEIIRQLKASGMACIYISHKLEEVAAVCDRISVIRDGRLIATTPMQELSLDQIVSQMVGRELTALYPQRSHEIGEICFEARHICCDDPVNPQRRKVDDVSFVLQRGEILGVAGLVGAGRSELMLAIFGAYSGASQGEVWLDGVRIDNRDPQHSIGAGLCMVPEDRKLQGIVADFSVAQNISLTVLPGYAFGGRIDGGAELHAVSGQIAALHIKTASPFAPITSLSGGNQQKAVLAKMLLARPKVLILDEPTRGVDVAAKAEIYQLIVGLAKAGVAIIMVSSDLGEVLGLSDRVLVMGEGQLRGDFLNQNLSQQTVLAAAINQHQPQPQSQAGGALPGQSVI